MSGHHEGPLLAFARSVQARIEQELERALPPASAPPTRLHAAMRHAMFPGGKRLRPVLALVACRVTGGDLERAMRPAAALECLHTYSLVHDDLPCMDDDDLRRGRPTCHVAFDEATAVLAGDALQALAFEMMAPAGAGAVVALAGAAGSHGMVGGQMGDIEAEGRGGDGSRAAVEWIHDRKTAALITAALEVGALAGGGVAEVPAALREFGMAIGRAFQIADDCLDLTGAVADLGKRPGQDVAARKLTFPAAMGLESSLAEARRLAARAGALAGEACRGRPPGPGLDDDLALLQDTALFLSDRTR